MRYEFTGNQNSFCLQTNDIKDVYDLIYVKWKVQKFQVRFSLLSKYRDDLYNVILTNKLGEEFACIGLLYDLECNPTKE